MKYILLLLFASISTTAFSQIVGKISDQTTKEVLAGVQITELGTNAGAISNSDGTFSIKTSSQDTKLIFTFPSYVTDTLETKGQKYISAELQKNNYLESVTIVSNTGSNYISEQSIDFKNTITSEGLTKLPCCNLSESFENTTGVDVTYSDAVSGTKQIKMLGLAGIYSQIMRENIPALRGLTVNSGLTYIPGPWMESIQLSKGASSVKCGSESLTGQINFEFKKPENSELLFANLFTNSEGRAEINLTSAYVFNKSLSGAILIHAANSDKIIDQNNDGFADIPVSTPVNILNRWKFESKNKKIESQFGFNYINEKKTGGQTDFVQNPEQNNEIYGIKINLKRYEIFAKTGFILPGTESGSVGTVFSVSETDFKSVFGNNFYSGNQKSFYANIIYEKEIFNHDNKINTGLSFIYDKFDEKFNDLHFPLTEKLPGVFAEYTFSHHDKISMSAGIRADYLNIEKILFVPRLHVKIKLFESLTLRTSAGKAFRTPHVFAENSAIFAKSANIIIKPEFNSEEAWNYGISAVIKNNNASDVFFSFSADFFRTEFINQTVVDYYTNAKEIKIYNSTDKSYANSMQAEFSIFPAKFMELMIAARYDDVKITLDNKLTEKPLVNKYKALFTASFYTKGRKWELDITNQYFGSAILPDLSKNQEATDFYRTAPAYYILHAQISRKFKHGFEIYSGAENITNFTQEYSVISPENPFGENFDASVIWGPLTGRVFYGGLRFKIN